MKKKPLNCLDCVTFRKLSNKWEYQKTQQNKIKEVGEKKSFFFRN